MARGDKGKKHKLSAKGGGSEIGPVPDDLGNGKQTKTKITKAGVSVNKKEELKARQAKQPKLSSMTKVNKKKEREASTDKAAANDRHRSSGAEVATQSRSNDVESGAKQGSSHGNSTEVVEFIENEEIMQMAVRDNEFLSEDEEEGEVREEMPEKEDDDTGDETEVDYEDNDYSSESEGELEVKDEAGDRVGRKKKEDQSRNNNANRYRKSIEEVIVYEINEELDDEEAQSMMKFARFLEKQGFLKSSGSPSDDRPLKEIMNQGETSMSERVTAKHP